MIQQVTDASVIKQILANASAATSQALPGVGVVYVDLTPFIIAIGAFLIIGLYLGYGLQKATICLEKFIAVEEKSSVASWTIITCLRLILTWVTIKYQPLGLAGLFTSAVMVSMSYFDIGMLFR
jgi:hypothetical protein